jgi:hypothetical protein
MHVFDALTLLAVFHMMLMSNANLRTLLVDLHFHRVQPATDPQDGEKS